jgi:hypothetical protein
MRIGILIATGFFCFGFLAAPTAEAQRRRGKQKPLPPPIVVPKVVCRLATGDGFGKIPQYAASFYRPGKLVYVGRQYTPRIGRYVYGLQDVFIKNLLLDAKACKLLALPTPPAAPPDIPTDTLYIWLDGKERTFAFNQVNGPEVLIKFTKKIREDLAAILEEQEPAEAPPKASGAK